MYSNILVPASSVRAVDSVMTHVDEVANDDATIHLLHVLTVDIGEDTSGTSAPDVPRTRGKQILTDSTELVGEYGYEVQTEISTGKPSKQITSYVNNIDADVVSMAMYGQSRMGRFIYGSVTESVVRNTTVPVVAVPLDP